MIKYNIINKPGFMKMYIIIGITGLLIISGICVYKNGRENNMNKKIPENTLAIFEDTGENYYLLEIDRVPDDQVNEYDILEFSGNGDYFLNLSLMFGNYPKKYHVGTYYLHIIPESSIFRIESLFITGEEFKNKKQTLSDWGTMEWDFEAYSTDKNNRWVKIFEYYVNNRNKN
jgi:hypothetical protein